MPLTIIRRVAPTLIGEVECVGFPFKPSGALFAFDTEGTGLDPWGKMGVDRLTYPARAFAFSFCDVEGNWAYIRWQVDARTRQVIVDKRTQEMLQILFDVRQHTVVMHNTMFDWRMMDAHDIHMHSKLYDTIIGQHVCNSDELSYGLKELSEKYLNISRLDQKDLGDDVKKIRGKIQRAKAKALEGLHLSQEESRLAQINIGESYKEDYWLGNPNKCREYAVTDAQRTMMLHQMQVEQFDSNKTMWKTFLEQMQLLRVVSKMEDRGVSIDIDKRLELERFYADYQAKAMVHIRDEAGPAFNPNSYIQKQKIFFGVRKLKPLEYKKEKRQKDNNPHTMCKGRGCAICQNTGWQPSTDADFLEHIGIEKKTDIHGNDLLVEKDRLAYWLLHHSAAHTMHGFLTGYDRMKSLDSDGSWILHANYKIAGPKTDRLSCEKPNLQNVAADDSGKKKSNVPYRIREIFIPRKGKLFYLPDYSQIEVWIAGLRAKCPSLLALLQAGGDSHGRIAFRIWSSDFNFDTAIESNTAIEQAPKGSQPKDILTLDQLGNWKTYKNRRKRSKFVQFGKIFGAGAKALAKQIGGGCTEAEGQRFSDEYDAAFPEVAQYMARTKAHCKQFGYVENAYERRIPVDPRFSYTGANYDIQSTAAHVIKRAMISIDQMIKQSYDGLLELLLTIHDELMIEGDDANHSKKVMKDIVGCMQQDSKFLGCPIPLPVGMKIATECWAKTQEVKL